MGTQMTQIERMIADMISLDPPDPHHQRSNLKSALIRLISVISVPI